jgi:hypothetical protein
LSGSVNGSTVTLNWLAPTGADPATSYVIEAGSSSGSTNIAVFDTLTPATTLTVNGVPPGTYFVRVRAKNSSGVAPTNLGASVNGSTVTLTWSAPGAGACAPISYNISAGSSPGLSNLARLAVGTNPTSFVATGVAAGVYYVRVGSGTPSGPGPVSNEIIVTVTGGPPTGGGVTAWWRTVTAPQIIPAIAASREQTSNSTCSKSGSNVTGTLTQTMRVSGCGGIGEVKTAPLIGTAGPGRSRLRSPITRRATGRRRSPLRE